MNARAMPLGAQVRPARTEDAAAIAALADQLGYPCTPTQAEQRLRGVLPDPQHGLFVAETAEGRVVGWVHVFAYACLESDLRAEVAGLVVGKSHRGTGVGRLLMQQAEQWAREKGLAVVGLRSNVIRTQAHAFYERLGYTSPKTQRAFRKNL
jgi:GNAT superfamily N-acetyltransferase